MKTLFQKATHLTTRQSSMRASNNRKQLTNKLIHVHVYIYIELTSVEKWTHIGFFASTLKVKHWSMMYTRKRHHDLQFCSRHQVPLKQYYITQQSLI